MVVHPLAELSRWTAVVENVHGPAALVELVVAVSPAAPPCLTAPPGSAYVSESSCLIDGMKTVLETLKFKHRLVPFLNQSFHFNKNEEKLFFCQCLNVDSLFVAIDSHPALPISVALAFFRCTSGRRRPGHLALWWRQGPRGARAAGQWLRIWPSHNSTPGEESVWKVQTKEKGGKNP